MHDCLGRLAAGRNTDTGEADWKDSLQYGLTRAVTGGILGSGSAKNRSWKQNTVRHGAAGSTGEVIRQLFEDPAESYQVSRTSCRQTRTPVEEMALCCIPEMVCPVTAHHLWRWGSATIRPWGTAMSRCLSRKR